ncbi:MAG: DegV family protein [Anaerolineales bacterium]|nr:DegV family protein [Anaerolineales bacterium]
MKIGIVTDSTSDLPTDLIQKYQIQVVPSILILEGKEYADGIGISREDFYTRLPTLQSKVTTAAPSIGDFLTPYQTLFSQGCDHIISIHAASQLTTILNSARQAAQEFGDKVTIIDSGSLSMGLGFQVLSAVDETVTTIKSAIEAIESTKKKLKVIAALDTMKYLKRSGRVPGLVANLGGMLSIKPMVEIKNGEVKPIGAVRTTKQMDEQVLNFLLEFGEMERLAILHTNAEARAKNLLNELTKKISLPSDVLFVNVTAVIGTHLGPNALGFAAVKK